MPSIGEAATALLFFCPDCLYIHFSSGAIWKREKGKVRVKMRRGADMGLLLLLLAITGVNCIFFCFFGLTFYTVNVFFLVFCGWKLSYSY